MRQHVGPVKNESQSNRHHPGGKMPKKPPKGMYIDKEDLLTVSNNQGDAVFKALDNDIVNAKRQVRTIMTGTRVYVKPSMPVQGCT